MEFFDIRGPSFWGDYGRILASGMVRCSDDESRPNLLLRTGPFIPPISFPFKHIVVTDEIRAELDRSRLGTFEFREILKHRVRKLHWETWDRHADVPAKLPRGGEPENYILSGWHSRAAALAMGQLWELLLPKGAETRGVRIQRNERRTPRERKWGVMVDQGTWTGEHLFRSVNQGYLIATMIGAEWLLKHCGEWVDLHDCIPWDPSKIDAEP